MHISLWQQFSSNHSASFVIVGQFDTVAMAEQTAAELRTMIREIGAWWEQFPDEDAQERAELALQDQGVVLTPPELRLREQYEVEWSHCRGIETLMAIDWIRDQQAANWVYQFRELVVLDPLADSNGGAHPFDLILVKLGGQVASDWEDRLRMKLHLHGTAPSVAVVEQLRQQIQRYTANQQSLLAIPQWGNAVPGTFSFTQENFTISNLELFWAGLNGDLLTRLQLLLSWLEQQGCYAIRYEFIEYSIR